MRFHDARFPLPLLTQIPLYFIAFFESGPILEHVCKLYVYISS